MSRKQPTSPVLQHQLSAKELEHASEDARTVVAQSPIVQTLVDAMITSRQLYMLARSALDNEVKNGWELQNPEWVIQTLVASAQSRAETQKFEIMEVQRAVLYRVVPFLDILIQQYKETGEEIFEETPDDSQEVDVPHDDHTAAESED